MSMVGHGSADYSDGNFDVSFLAVILVMVILMFLFLVTILMMLILMFPFLVVILIILVITLCTRSLDQDNLGSRP